jgi:hypothetical protein
VLRVVGIPRPRIDAVVAHVSVTGDACILPLRRGRQSESVDVKVGQNVRVQSAVRDRESTTLGTGVAKLNRFEPGDRIDWQRKVPERGSDLACYSLIELLCDREYGDREWARDLDLVRNVLPRLVNGLLF